MQIDSKSILQGVLLPKQNVLPVVTNGGTRNIHKDDVLAAVDKSEGSLIQVEGKWFVQFSKGRVLCDQKKAERFVSVREKSNQCKYTGKRVGLTKSHRDHGSAECPYCGRVLAVTPEELVVAVSYEEDEDPETFGSAVLPQHKEAR